MDTAKPETPKNQVRKRRAVRRLSVAATVLLLLVAGLVVGALWLYFVSPQTDAEANGPVQLRVKEGATTAEIARRSWQPA